MAFCRYEESTTYAKGSSKRRNLIVLRAALSVAENKPMLMRPIAPPMMVGVAANELIGHPRQSKRLFI
jgi:hypothetical protein